MVDKYKALVAPNCKLDQHTVDIICEHIANGNYPSVACEAAGVSDETLRQWVIRAEAYQASEVRPDSTHPSDCRDVLRS